MREPSLWLPEPDAVLHQVMGKLAEEAAELACALVRGMIQGYHQKHPVTGKSNEQWILEEMGDVKAGLLLMQGFAPITAAGIAGVETRASIKYDHKAEWLAAVADYVAEKK